ncbi:Twin-arginine translocation pathway signal [Rubrobacter xylanophilus DSM 9941]|uniref:Twin-arginine translocation pathway signal n=1 Tax=Rubrobacter xylanophilus (strain DSM 9941 / JCM 11954 / NBRC 16129 / PRD-1) TaxID=266117 RepID=Q1AUN3_RUBXD|nr:hypothetical protein [Rubrobacter xylanophilus]ABG04895.1 Twin-arginine translocation pathway signal [Rubrobacter xylanophilus DSM 9941]
MDPEGGSGQRRFSRREALILGAAASVLVALGTGARGSSGHEAREKVLLHKGRRIAIRRVRGRRELYIEGEHIRTVHSNGAYRAEGFVFSPSPTLEELAREMVDYRAALQARRARFLAARR